MRKKQKPEIREIKPMLFICGDREKNGCHVGFRIVSKKKGKKHA